MEATRGIPRLSVNQRAQHAVLGAAVIFALGTGLAAGLHPATAGRAQPLHVGAGLLAFAALAYHAVYLAVRGYVEGRGWSTLPLRWTGADTTAAAAELRAIAGSGPRPSGGEYRVTQKLLYWWTGAAVGVVGATGIGLGYWETLGTLARLPGLAALHRGFALLLLASLLWHLYGVFTWAGRWRPEWSWLTGELDEGKARLKVPGALQRRRALEAEESGAAGGSNEERSRERQAGERAEVEAELEKGNRLALQEQYVEALYHYRRALELFPGYSQARYNMARVLARMGERESAREAYLLFLAAEPFHPLARKAQEAIEELSAGGGAP